MRSDHCDKFSVNADRIFGFFSLDNRFYFYCLIAVTY